MTGDGQKRTVWNTAVLEELGRLCAHTVISIQHGEHPPEKANYSHFPLKTVGQPWSIVADELFKALLDEPIVRLHRGGYAK